MDQSTKDFLSILIPAVATVLTALIAAMAEVAKTRKSQARPGAQPARHGTAKPPYRVTPPLIPPAKTPAFYRSPIFAGVLISAAFSLGAVFFLRLAIPTIPSVTATPPPTVTVVPSPTTTPTLTPLPPTAVSTPTPLPPPELILERLVISFSSPETLPGPDIPVSVPLRPHTIGRTTFVRDYDRYVWVFVCKQSQQGEPSCTVSGLALTLVGRWNDFIQIGRETPEDDCAVFSVGFAVVDGETNRDLKSVLNLPEPIIAQNRLPRDKFLQVEWHLAVRDLSSRLSPICVNTPAP